MDQYNSLSSLCLYMSCLRLFKKITQIETVTNRILLNLNSSSHFPWYVLGHYFPKNKIIFLPITFFRCSCLLLHRETRNKEVITLLAYCYAVKLNNSACALNATSSYFLKIIVVVVVIFFFSSTFSDLYII